MLIVGTVLKSEHITGSREATATAEARSWDFWQVTVWDGNEAQSCMVGRDVDPTSFGAGEDVVLDVTVNPRRDTRTGVWQNSVNIVGRLTPEALLDRLPAVASRAA